MDLILDDIEVRILGSLMEKERTTPESYPLSLNGLWRACNQKSNRDPVLSLHDDFVFRTIEKLIDKKLARRVIADDGRVPKYRQILPEAFSLDTAEMAALCVLFLRGPQTLGEIRGRTERLHSFESLGEIEETLASLRDKPSPMATQLPRQPGTKESRYAHLFSGPVEVIQEVPEEPAAVRFRADNERLDDLESQVSDLRRELDELKTTLEDFQNQFR